MHYIDTSHNPTSTNMLEITYSGVNIHLAIQTTPKITPAIRDNEMKARLSDGITMESIHITTLQLPGLIRLEL